MPMVPAYIIAQDLHDVEGITCKSALQPQTVYEEAQR